MTGSNPNSDDIIILILTFNQREKTLAVLRSLRQIQTPAFQVLVWDNGSQDGTAAALSDQFPEVVYHASSRNLGVASGRNGAAALAIQRFDPRFLLFLDNDMELDSGFVEGLLDPFLTDPAQKVGQTQAKLLFMDDRRRINDGGGSRINFILGETIPVGYNEIDEGQHDAIKPCVSCGGAMMVRRDVFEELGGFDPLFDPFGPEDADFSLRLQKAGYQALYTPRAVAFHEVSHTFGKGYTEEYARYKSKHWLTFLRRHATPLQKAGFYLVGAPILALRIIIREGKKGNLGAVRGIIRGLVETANPFKK